jgi:hypothetical protein
VRARRRPADLSNVGIKNCSTVQLKGNKVWRLWRMYASLQLAHAGNVIMNVRWAAAQLIVSKTCDNSKLHHTQAISA